MEKFRKQIGDYLITVDKNKGKEHPYLVMVTQNGIIIDFAGKTFSRNAAMDLAKDKIRQYQALPASR